MDYDRNASKRTTVVDDQSDFFEIDSNAWLSDEVCLDGLLTVTQMKMADMMPAHAVS